MTQPPTPKQSDRYPGDEVEPEIGTGLSDLEAIIAALRDGPIGFGLPLVAAAHRYTRHAVGGPLWVAMEVAHAAGMIRVIPYAESDQRGLETNGWRLCEDIR